MGDKCQETIMKNKKMMTKNPPRLARAYHTKPMRKDQKTKLNKFMTAIANCSHEPIKVHNIDNKLETIHNALLFTTGDNDNEWILYNKKHNYLGACTPLLGTLKCIRWNETKPERLHLKRARYTGSGWTEWKITETGETIRDYKNRQNNNKDFKMELPDLKNNWKMCSLDDNLDKKKQILSLLGYNNINNTDLVTLDITRNMTPVDDGMLTVKCGKKSYDFNKCVKMMVERHDMHVIWLHKNGAIKETVRKGVKRQHRRFALFASGQHVTMYHPPMQYSVFHKNKRAKIVRKKSDTNQTLITKDWKPTSQSISLKRAVHKSIHSNPEELQWLSVTAREKLRIENPESVVHNLHQPQITDIFPTASPEFEEKKDVEIKCHRGSARRCGAAIIIKGLNWRTSRKDVIEFVSKKILHKYIWNPQGTHCYLHPEKYFLVQDLCTNFMNFCAVGVKGKVWLKSQKNPVNWTTLYDSWKTGKPKIAHDPQEPKKREVITLEKTRESAVNHKKRMIKQKISDWKRNPRMCRGTRIASLNLGIGMRGGLGSGLSVRPAELDNILDDLGVS